MRKTCHHDIKQNTKIVIILISTISLMPILTHPAVADETYNMPAWITYLKNWQSQGSITNSEYTHAVEYLFSQGIL